MREEVINFGAAMEKKLLENDHKGGWENCSFEFLIMKLYEEFQEVLEGFDLTIEDLENPDGLKYKGHKMHVLIDECPDLANIAMMIYDNTWRAYDVHSRE